MPFPKEDVTPPVTKMNFEATGLLFVLWTTKVAFIFEKPEFTFPRSNFSFKKYPGKFR
jgi:hypothetical protein